MLNKKRFKRWCYYNVIAIDQLFNALISGAADETLSSRAYRCAVVTEHPRKRWIIIHRFINGLFFNREHCKVAYFSEVYRRQYTEDFQREVAK